MYRGKVCVDDCSLNAYVSLAKGNVENKLVPHDEALLHVPAGVAVARRLRQQLGNTNVACDPLTKATPSSTPTSLATRCRATCSSRPTSTTTCTMARSAWATAGWPTRCPGCSRP